MENYNLIQFEVPLDDLNTHIGSVLHYQRWSDEDIEVDPGLGEDFLGMVVNLSKHNQPYQFDHLKGTFPRDYFNFFFIPKDKCRFTLKAGLTSLLFWKCTEAFLQQFVCDTELLAPFLNRTRAGVSAVMNAKQNPISYEMLDDVVSLMTMRNFKGTTRAMYVRVKASNMLICGIMRSHEQFIRQRKDPAKVGMQVVYQYMVDNLKFIHCPSTLAIKADMRERKFRDTFRTIYGTSVQDALKSERMKKAVNLLIDTQLAMHQISDEVGYMSSTSFLGAFKDRYGIYPTEFRNTYGGKGVLEWKE